MLIYLDSAELSDVRGYANDERVAGHTYNPLLARKATVLDYERHARDILDLTSKPVSIQVVADDLPGIEEQARKIAAWADHAIVKIPVTTTDGTPTRDLVRTLSDDGIPINVTAVFTLHQVTELLHSHASIISIFAGRIADTGVDPSTVVQRARQLMPTSTKVLWASPRAVWDFHWAYKSWADIITMTPDLIEKTSLKGYDLDQFSLDTVNQFDIASRTAGYSL